MTKVVDNWAWIQGVSYKVGDYDKKMDAFPVSITEYANLIWHSGNIYAHGETPASLTFTRAASECSDALKYANLNAVSESGVRL